MNTISQFTPNYTVNIQTRKQNVQFRGNLGDKFVNQIINGTSVQAKDVVKEMKGTFGIKTDKAEDIVESFIGKVRDLFKEKMNLSLKLNEQQREINAFPREKQDAIYEAENKIRDNFQQIIRSKNEEVAAKDKEVADMKSQLEKYQQVVKVKSVEEIGTIMPDKAIELMDEIMKNKIPARKSMAEFLLTGKGQEEALEQIERNNMLMKAHQDGITQIPEVDAKNKEMQKAFIYFSNDYNFTINLIGQALAGSPKGNYIKSQAIKNQIKDNAMAILKPMANERYYNSGLGSIEQELDKCLTITEKYHDGLAKGIAKIKSKVGKDIKSAEFKPAEFSVENSKVIITGNDGASREENYRWISNYGNSSY